MIVSNAGIAGGGLLPPRGGPAALSGYNRIRACSTNDYDEETRVLGSGGFGSVVKARHRVTGETVAVKKFRSSSTTNKDVLREASFLLACDGHPSIVQFRALSVDLTGASNHSLVMEHLGPSLHDVLRKLRRGRPFPEDKVRVIMWQLLGAVKHMHDLRIVHRDIKPKNILIGDHGVKLGDFGLAMDMAVAPPYMKCGTRRYMAPEMLQRKTDYDAMVDMWSLGCVMAELLAGKPLFGGEDDMDQLASIYDVLRMPYINWPEYNSLPAAVRLVRRPRFQYRNRLRECFPEEQLSKEGFDVLQGLLCCDSSGRLSAADALQHPWFSNV